MTYRSPHLLDGDPDDQALLEQVHPQPWPEPMPPGRYNLVVLGGGTAGLVSAAAAAGLGAKVALVEKSLLGGDCLNVGCVPSKLLLSAGRAAAALRHAGEHGIQAQAQVDFGMLMQRLRRLRAQIAQNDSAERFRKLGVDVFLGEGRFSGPAQVEVNGKTLRFAKAIIATGARAALPPIPGLAEAEPLTNETVFRLTKQPQRLAVLGAGPIGCELAQAFARLGTRVHLVDLAAQVLPRESSEAAAVLQAALQEDGVSLHLSTKTLRVERRGALKHLQLQAPQGLEELEVDTVLVAAGRTPNVERLGLEVAGVDSDRLGVKVDDRLRSSNPRIYAAGDVCSTYKFTHAADFLARTAIQNALFLGRKKASALLIPWCTYTDPEIAQVGLSEQEAHTSGVKVLVFKRSFAEVDRAIASGDTRGFVKIVAQARSGRILGATIVGKQAGDLISEIAVAMRSGLSLGTLATVIHPYPTLAEAIRHCGDQFNRTRLTPRIAALLKAWLRWQRS